MVHWRAKVWPWNRWADQQFVLELSRANVSWHSVGSTNWVLQQWSQSEWCSGIKDNWWTECLSWMFCPLCIKVFQLRSVNLQPPLKTNSEIFLYKFLRDAVKKTGYFMTSCKIHLTPTHQIVTKYVIYYDILGKGSIKKKSEIFQIWSDLN